MHKMRPYQRELFCEEYSCKRHKFHSLYFGDEDEIKITTIFCKFFILKNAKKTGCVFYFQVVILDMEENEEQLNYFKGRGAQLNTTNRFLKNTYVTEHDEVLDEPLLSNEKTQIFYEYPKKIINEVKAETGAKGKELFHPVRLVLTGSHSGPEFDKLIPILEEGSRLPLPKPVLNVQQRGSQFSKARGK